MKVEIILAKIEDKPTLANLLEKYNYEFSQYDCRPFNNNGLYGYEYLDRYWIEDVRFPYLIKVDDKLAGFALINNIAECAEKCNWSVAEFFVGYPYRNKGVGTRAMMKIFDKHKGLWHIKYHCRNIVSVGFWNKIARLFAKKEVKVFDTQDFYNASKGKVLTFEV
ncbi:MAG: GNAT family N-acetyltransferase [Clostridia bacterium]|nr:GNAT family N-acetyltransferase [Clostridia bacterium]MDE6211067.1 GNAT family N-acetyltransferase [Clostridia bacterium]MDE7209725.1 GNAT family N-acetyltransferase [Clostridia bacterium]